MYVQYVWQRWKRLRLKGALLQQKVFHRRWECFVRTFLWATWNTFCNIAFIFHITVTMSNFCSDFARFCFLSLSLPSTANGQIDYNNECKCWIYCLSCCCCCCCLFCLRVRSKNKVSQFNIAQTMTNNHWKHCVVKLFVVAYREKTLTQNTQFNHSMCGMR